MVFGCKVSRDVLFPYADALLTSLQPAVIKSGVGMDMQGETGIVVMINDSRCRDSFRIDSIKVMAFRQLVMGIITSGKSFRNSLNQWFLPFLFPFLIAILWQYILRGSVFMNSFLFDDYVSHFILLNLFEHT